MKRQISKSRKDRTIQYAQALQRLYQKHLDMTFEDLAGNATLTQQLVFLGVKMFSNLPGSLVHDMDRKMTEGSLGEYFKTVGMIALLTPRQFMQVFPVAKDYDGEKYEMKDYFFTMEEIEKIGVDNVIGEDRVDLFLMEYWNKDVVNFLVNGMMIIDRNRAFDGLPSMMEEFMAEKGVQGYTYYEEEGIMVDGNGKVLKAEKPKRRKPKYIKVLEGGKK